MTAAPAATSTALGTPKEGIDCGECSDWGTVVVDQAPGYTGGTEVLCPLECAAAARIRDQRPELS